MKGFDYMKTIKLPKGKELYFVGSYIRNIIDYADRSYISVMLSPGNKGEAGAPIYIMVFKETGFKKKVTNPMVQILRDAFVNRMPVACVYYDNGQGNVMQCVYTNFFILDWANTVSRTNQGEIPIVSTDDTASEYAILDEDEPIPF